MSDSDVCGKCQRCMLRGSVFLDYPDLNLFKKNLYSTYNTHDINYEGSSGIA